MQRRSTIIAICLGAFFLLSVTASADYSWRLSVSIRPGRPTAQTKPSKDLEAVALKVISDREKIPQPDLEIETSAIVTYRYSGRSVNEFHIGNRRNDQSYQVIL